MGPTSMKRTFYEPGGSALKHDPLKAIVAPRPIGWISTYSADRVANLAPYSFFNLVADSPKIVMFASVGWKDSARNAVASGGFAANLATEDLLHQMNVTSGNHASATSEFDVARLERTDCRRVDAPMLATARAVIECEVTETLIPRTTSGDETESVIVFGQVVAYHIDDALIVDGRFDSAKARLLSRLGYFDYGVVDRTFELRRP